MITRMYERCRAFLIVSSGMIKQMEFEVHKVCTFVYTFEWIIFAIIRLRKVKVEIYLFSLTFLRLNKVCILKNRFRMFPVLFSFRALSVDWNKLQDYVAACDRYFLHSFSVSV